ncbi:MAG: hypothetical protein M3Y07_03395 [Acidobacteriota bacterium]|nr:hypothetical protein [Acidobacteriota bacterium]
MRTVSLVVMYRRNFRLPVLAFFLAALLFAAPPPKIRISAWYWLNSAPKSEWSRDFRAMSEMGFTDVLLCWGLDAAAFGLPGRVQDSLDAMRLAHEVGVGSYIVFWHPTHNSLERRPEFQQVDAAGHHLFAFDTFNPEWRRTQWRDYLQLVARTYRQAPGFSGYVFDDSFGIGPIDTFGGKPVPVNDRYISYNGFEKNAFQGDLPRKPGDPQWDRWSDARAKWWEDWGRDTVGFIRKVDPDKAHEIYIEDEAHVLSPKMKNSVGLDFGRLGRQFDAVGAYTEIAWDSPDASKGARITTDVLARTRAAVGPNTKIIYTFWIANAPEERKPGPAQYPTVQQIKAVSEAALKAGIRHLDMYGYRIGEFVVDPPSDWAKARPGTGAAYPVTGQFPKKFLWDRPQLHKELGEYLRGLNGR